MIYPEFLKQGNTIGVPAPSSGAYDEPHINRFKNAKKKIEERGYNVVYSENIYKDVLARSASAEVRGKEINDMFSNDNIDFIIAAAGGEFLVECLPYIDFDMIASKKKYFCGFSDPTGIIWPLTTKYDISTIYGMNFGEYGMEDYYENINNNLEILQGNLVEQNSFEKYDNGETKSVTGLESYVLTEKNEWKVLNGDSVKISGRVLAGCFDLIAELAGTKYDGTPDFVEKYKEDGTVFVFDNCELSKEETIRVLWKFNELGYFKYCKGVIFGKFGVDGESFVGYENVAQALNDSILKKLNIPVVYDADISHKDPCMTIVNGSIIDVDVKDGKAKVNMKLK